MADQKDKQRPRVVVLGGGFAGINAAKTLARLPVDVTLVDRRNHHTFQPLLYQVALAVLSPADIAQPLRTVFRDDENVEVLMEEAVGVDVNARRVAFSSGAHADYDYLLVATGSTHSYFGHDEWAPVAPGLKTIEDATEIRRRVLLAFELAEREKVEGEPTLPLTFVVVGGGPTGVELAGAISDIARVYMRKDFRHIDTTKARVVIFEGGPRVLAAYPEELSKKAVEQLQDLGVEVHTSAHVTDVQPGYVVVGGEKIPSAVTLWGAGVQASPLGKLLGFPVDKRGSVIVDAQLNPPGHREIFVLGDLAHVEENGKQVPGVAQPAMQMGKYAARAIKADLEGKPRGNFHYFDKGDMATIGRKAAVARIVWPFHANWSGIPAWLTWLAVHIWFLIGFRNRVAVFSQWAWTYFTTSRGARLITGSQVLPGWSAAPERMDLASPSAPGTAVESK